MRGLVVGGGSIGRRHLQNLKLLGVDTLALVEPDRERQQAVISECNVAGFAELEA
jgi:predicted dehydrogenase